MGCSSSKALEEQPEKQGWFDSEQSTVDNKCQTLSTASSPFETLTVDGHRGSDLRSLMRNDRARLDPDEQYADAASDLPSNEVSEATSECNTKADMNVVTATRKLASEGDEKSDLVEMRDAMADSNIFASSSPDCTRKSDRLQMTENKDSRITLQEILKARNLSERKHFNASARGGSEKENNKFGGKRFRSQSAKLHKEKRLLPSVFRRKSNSRKESKVKLSDDTKKGGNSSSKRQSFADLTEKNRNGTKNIPQRPQLKENITSVKDLFYGALLKDYKEGSQMNFHSVKFSQKTSSSLGLFNGSSTHSPDDLQSNGGTTYDSISFETAEDQFSADDYSKESYSVSSTFDVYNDCYFDAEKSKPPSRTPTRMGMSSPEETNDIFSISLEALTNRIDKIHLRRLESAPLEQFEFRCPSGDDKQVVLYTTSLRSIRKTYEECSSVRMILQGFSIRFDERDISMQSGFKQELKDLLPELAAHVPRLFIKGRYIGGAEEVFQLNENGILIKLLENLPKQEYKKEPCEGCGGMRFVPCPNCAGSCKVVIEEKTVVQCSICNENGLIRCPICC